MLNISKKNSRWIKHELQSNEVIVWAKFSYSEAPRGLISTCVFLFIAVFTIYIFPIEFVVFFGVLCLIRSVYSLFIVIFIVSFFPIEVAVFFGILYLIQTISLLFYGLTPKLISSVYIITNLRVIILNNTQTRKFVSYYPDQLKYFERQQSPDGSGSIIFKVEPLKSGLWGNFAKNPNLKNLNDVNKVGDILNKLSRSPYS